MPGRRRRRPAAGGVAHAVDTAGAARAHRAIFRTVRADRQGHLVRRAVGDRRDHGDYREPEGGDGGAGGVLRGRTGAAGQGEGLVHSLSSLRKQGPIRRGSSIEHGGSRLESQLTFVVMCPCFRRDDEGQCRKCRTPVNTMAMPASSAAFITSSSRIDPPGWITAVAPASIATNSPSANGKNASDATTEPLVMGCASFASSAASCALRAAIRAESTRLIWPAPMPTVARSLA